MRDFQKRVVDEKADLDRKLGALRDFIDGAGNTSVFAELPDEERERLTRQRDCMSAYSDVLGERIEAFDLG